MTAPLVLAAVLWRAPAPLTVPNGTERSVTLPAVGTPARLAFRVRADYPRFAGSNLFLRLLVNGAEVGPMRDRRASRLVRAPVQPGSLVPFALGRWRIGYGPASRPGDELVLDVSDLVRGDRPNVVTFAHGPATSVGETPLVVEELRLERAPPSTAVTAPSSPPDDSTPRLGFPQPPAFTTTATRQGVEVAWAGRTVAVRTRVRGGPNRWRRAIITTPTHVEVRDTIENPTAAPIGLRIRHAVASESPWVRLGGWSAPEVTDAYDPWNPTVFAPLGNAGIGLVAEDDVFRQQVHVDWDATEESVGVRTDTLCLGPGETETLVWSIYPTGRASYWDFLNTLRADWGVDGTVPGAYLWFTPDQILALPEAELRATLARRGVAIASMWGGWRDPQRSDRPPRIGFGTAVLADDFAALRERIRTATARLKAARPGLDVLLYFDAQRDSSPDAPRRYADSLRDGAQGRTDWGGRYSPSWDVVPTASTSFGRAMGRVPAAMRALGADGLYWDEMDAVDYGGPRVTTRIADGRTCTLDDAGQIAGRLGLANLLSDEVKLGWAAGRRVLGNSPPTTRRFQRRPDLRMVEMQHGREWAAFAQLTTPLGYIGDRRDFAAVVDLVDAGLLAAAPRLAYAYDPPRLFPLTPEYLQPGTLRGHERIVTTRSGTHGWTTGGGAVHAFRYDRDGHERPADWHVKRRGDVVLIHVRLAAGELGVIEREDAR